MVKSLSIYNEKFFRNLGIINKAEQEIIKNTEIIIVGLGGTGGTAFECLLRLGCQNFILFDHDRFELTNFNRQLLAIDSALDQEKTKIAAERANLINKNAKIKTFGEFDAVKIKNAKIVIDGTDNIETRIKISTACRKLNVPYIFCSASFTIGMVSVFINCDFEKVFQIYKKKNLAGYNTCVSVIAPATMLAGTLASAQAINYLLKKPFIRAPDILFFDLFSEHPICKKRLE